MSVKNNFVDDDKKIPAVDNEVMDNVVDNDKKMSAVEQNKENENEVFVDCIQDEVLNESEGAQLV